MPARWRDPDDTAPSAARTAREIAGYRAYCPLRWMVRRHGAASPVTERHIYAADRLRLAFDLAGLGATGPRELTPVLAIVHGPRGMPSAAALLQVHALVEFRRAMRLYDQLERPLVAAVILFNRSLSAWCAALRDSGASPQPAVERTRLVVCLDKLEEHYRSEIDEDLARGRLLVA